MRYVLTLTAILLIAVTASAAESRLVLPPTPSLPLGTINKHLQIGGARIWYAEWGNVATGEPVLLLHGGLGNSNYFGNLIPALVSHGYHVIAMDSRGHGRSTRSLQHITYHLMATDVIALLDALKIEQVNLIGWSDGGNTGLDLEVNHPERLRRLFAFGANANSSALIDGFQREPVFAAYAHRVKQEYDVLSPAPTDWDAFNADMDKMWEALPNFTPQQLHSIRVPTTIADGQYDELIKPEHTRYLAAAIPNAKLVILPDVGHFAILQDAAVFNAAVLTSLAPPK
jgi:pimeloyl-ACP methyl ester carboxylesterase